MKYRLAFVVLSGRAPPVLASIRPEVLRLLIKKFSQGFPIQRSGEVREGLLVGAQNCAELLLLYRCTLGPLLPLRASSCASFGKHTSIKEGLKYLRPTMISISCIGCSDGATANSSAGMYPASPYLPFFAKKICEQPAGEA